MVTDVTITGKPGITVDFLYCKPGLTNWVQVDPRGSIARVHGVHLKMLSCTYIMRA